MGQCKKTFSSLEEIELHRKKNVEDLKEIDLLKEIESIKALNDPRVKILTYTPHKVTVDEGNGVGVYTLSEKLITKFREILDE